MEWRNGGITEYAEYSKIRNIWNILKHGKYEIFGNTIYTESFKMRNERKVFKKSQDSLVWVG